MAYKTEEAYLWDLKMTLIKALTPLIVASLALSQIFSSKEFAVNSYLLSILVFLILLLLATIEIVMFGKSAETRKKSKKRRK